MNDSPHPAPDLPPGLWRHDESLRRAAELLELAGSRVRAVSFDFFDTLVWRLAAKPVDAFLEAGDRLRQKQLLRPTISSADFKMLRQVAEWKMRERQALQDPTREDISILKIYEQLSEVLTDPAAGVDIECAVEGDFCQVNPVMAGFIQYLRQRGLRVLVISDIYLSPAQLRGILCANRFDPEIFDAIFTSSDTGRSKGTGNLFRHALKTLHLDPDQLFHVGDNLSTDVIGARKAGVRGCHYRQATPEINTILDREKFLMGGQATAYSFDSLRQLAARHFAGSSEESFFGRSGALLFGPLLTRYAAWACGQFAAAGVRKVGAFMREGEILGQLLQHESDAMGHALEITPLYVNRKSTDLAAIDKLSADNIVDWLERRQTLPVRTILEHFGLHAADMENLPLPPDEKVNTRERILKLAKFLFTPGIAGRIEARSAEERRKVIDYIRPWIESGAPVGLCDLGYNASAQNQLKRILEIEGIPARLIGCYLVTCERAARRLLDGLDVRHFLGAFGEPGLHHFAFLRSPAFAEQCLVAPCGTTLGYERAADGRVKPVLDETRFPEELLLRQRAFKDGLLFFQKLWLWCRAQKPALFDGASEKSRRVLAELDRSCATILARVTAFPLPGEQLHFGSLPLDDYYFAEGVKTICSPSERELARTGGYSMLLNRQGVLWPQGAFHIENARLASDFFSCGKAMLLCNPNGDDNGVAPELSMVLSPQQHPDLLRECLARLKPAALRNALCKIVVLAAKDDCETKVVAKGFSRDIKRLCVLSARPQQNRLQQLNLAVDGADSTFVAIFDGGAPFAPGWDEAMLNAIRSAPDVAIVLPSPGLKVEKLEKAMLENAMEAMGRVVILRKSAFLEGLGFNDKIGRTASLWDLVFKMRELGWKTRVCPGVLEEKKAISTNRLPATDAKFLKQRWPDFTTSVIAVLHDLVGTTHGDFRAQEAGSDVCPDSFSDSSVPHPCQKEYPLASTVIAPAKPVPLVNIELNIDWIGSFLDHGSLSHVNRELTAELRSLSAFHIHRVNNGVVSPSFENLTHDISAPSPVAAVTVRHSWPPDWKRPQTGKLVVIQPWEFGPLPQEWVERARNVDEFWVPTRFVRDRYLESGIPAEKVFVVPNGIDPEKFHPQAAPMKLATQKNFKFLFVGGTIGRKGPDILLKAYLESFTAADDVCLVIKDFGGKTVYHGQTFVAQIQAAQARPGAPEILYLDEELPADALPGLYTACDCLTQPYRGEGFGLPVLEAMACGLPVIVTEGGATDDFASKEFVRRIPSTRISIGDNVSGMKLAGPGWLLEPDVHALAAQMKWIVSNNAAARELGACASKFARSEWTWQHAAQIAGQRIQALVASVAPASRSAISPVLKTNKPSTTFPPPVARLGQLDEAREFFHRDELQAAWKSAFAAIQIRPFHPEGFLLLGEISLAAGDPRNAKLCARRAHELAPNWKPAKLLLRKAEVGNRKSENSELLSLIAADISRISQHTSRLSICLIARNEERFLAQCLASIKDLATQIIVVDTGSTDRTLEIAKGSGAEVYSFAWCDDFSAARNVALEYATGDWILILDADEELPAAQHARLRADMQRTDAIACRLPLVDHGHETKGQSFVPRLFRNAPEVFYHGRIHEQVFPSLVECGKKWGLITGVGTAQLLHHGYTKEIVRERNKTGRNLHLLRLAVEEQPEEANLQMNLGLELIRTGDMAAGLACYRKALTLMSAQPPSALVPELREALLTQFARHLHNVRGHDEIVRMLTSPLARNGGLTASLHLALGLAYFELKQFSEAADQMRQCLSRRKQAALSPINPDILTAVPHHCLAMSLIKLGDVVGAEKAFQAGLGETGDELKLDYAKFLALQNRLVDALRQLHEIVRVNAGNAVAWRLGGEIALSKPDYLKFASDWTAEAIRQLPEDGVIIGQRAEALLLSQDNLAALPLWLRAINGQRPPRALAAQIICGLLTAHPAEKLHNCVEEGAVSHAFVGWYRQLVAVGARDTIVHLNSSVEKLRPILPSAATVLDGVVAAMSVPQMVEAAAD